LGMIPGFKMLNVPYVVLYRNILHAFACGAWKCLETVYILTPWLCCTVLMMST
jgi:hypothetical protein